jgi:hypothetical protein
MLLGLENAQFVSGGDWRSVNVSTNVLMIGISVCNRWLKIEHGWVVSVYSSTLGGPIVRVCAGGCHCEIDG